MPTSTMKGALILGHKTGLLIVRMHASQRRKGFPGIFLREVACFVVLRAYPTKERETQSMAVHLYVWYS